ncbi:partial RecBCD enzyme subunit RecD, partial [Patescibacteria group bacterium]
LEDRAHLTGTKKHLFGKLIKFLSYQHNQGHSCIVLNEQEQALISASGLAMLNPLTDTELLPLVLEQNRLYLQRYWFYEHRLMLQLKRIAQQSYDITELQDLLNSYFNDESQKAAASIALKQGFSIITGGPGTGKTTTVVRILALLQQQFITKPLHIALAAPTGKAAMRLQESIGFNKNTLPCSDDIKALIPETVTTLHRLLGAKPVTPYFKHSAEHPLIYDVVVVDEASMVDLALMSKLLDALKPSARLILLGDKDQLASVESGAVLADLTEALPEHTAELKTAHRFNEHIKQLASAVNHQQTDLAWQLFNSGNANIHLLSTDLISHIAAKQADYLQFIEQNKPFNEIYALFNRFQVLCSNREGKNGVIDINYRVEQKLAQQGRIQLSGFWYKGRPIMITQNNPSLHLYNGDIGLCLPNKDGKLMVWFLRPDGTIKTYLPSRIVQCETVFAMTIHKSQGSEFNEVLIVLPDSMNPVLTKELLYTAITRAKDTIQLIANKQVFSATIQQKISRVTGLVNKF